MEAEVEVVVAIGRQKQLLALPCRRLVVVEVEVERSIAAVEVDHCY